MNFKTMSPITILTIVIVALVGTVGVIYAVGQLTTISGNVTVITQASVTADPDTLEWGSITRGTSKTLPVTIHNSGGTPTGILIINNNLPAGLELTPDNTDPIPAGGDSIIIFTLKASITAPLGTTPYLITIED